MLTYNTQLKKIALPEYGRNIQRMVDHCLTIADRDERTACAHSIIRAMEVLFPPTGDRQEYRQKLWHHLAIMADFQLDIDWPFEPLHSEELSTKPEAVPYTITDIPYRHYGKNLQYMVEEASKMEPSPEKDAIILLLANQMKKLQLAVNPEGVDDAKVFKDLLHISHGAIRLDPAEVHLHEFTALPAPSKKKKKK